MAERLAADSGRQQSSEAVCKLTGVVWVWEFREVTVSFLEMIWQSVPTWRSWVPLRVQDADEEEWVSLIKSYSCRKPSQLIDLYNFIQMDK